MKMTKADSRESPHFFTGLKSLEDNMRWDFKHAALIPKQGFCATIFGCGKEARYK